MSDLTKQQRLEAYKHVIYLEVWVEKDALSGVLKRVTEKYHVPILVNRGYSSASAMYDSFMRFVSNADGTDEKERQARINLLTKIINELEKSEKVKGMKNELEKLIEFTSMCREDLDNARGNSIDIDSVVRKYQEYVIVLNNNDNQTVLKINLATLIALARKAQL